MQNEKIILLIDIWIQIALISIGVWSIALDYNRLFVFLFIPYQALVSANVHIVARKYINQEVYQKRKIYLGFFWGFIVTIALITQTIFTNNDAWKILAIISVLFQFGLGGFYLFISIQDYKS